jgi:Flp pilus assembly protein TadG
MVIVRKRKGNRSRGAAMVEAALVLPILLLVTFGAIKYGWLFLRAQQITNAARYGARMASLPDVEDDAVKTSIISLLAATNIDVNDQDIIIQPVEVSLSEHSAVNVHITVPSKKVDILKISLFPDVGNIVASVTMAEEL